MTIQFNSMPTDLRDPGSYNEIAAGPLQGLPVMPNNTIMLGQMLASGSATPNVPVQVYSPSQAVGLFGAGSMLARKCAVFLQANPWTPLFVCPQQDNAEGTAAIFHTVVTGSPTADATQPFYIDGTQILVALTAGMTAAEVASALLAAIEEEVGLPVSSAIDGVDAYQIDHTCLHKGLDAGSLDFRTLYYGSDANVPGVTFTTSVATAGAGNPSLTTAIANLAPAWYLFWDNSYTDSESLDAIAAALEANWGPTAQKDSLAFFSQNASFGAAATMGESLNEKLFVYMPVQNPPQAPYLWASALAAIEAYYALQLLPTWTLGLTGLLAPAQADRWTPPERNMLDYDGVANYLVNDSGNVQIARAITTYINDAEGVADTTFLDDIDVIRAAYIRYDKRVFDYQTWPRYNIGDDGDTITVGTKITTSSRMAGAYVGWAETLVKDGVITNLAFFIAGIVVERDATDKTRANVLMPVVPVKGLATNAGQIQLNQA
jgi:phage tail sheath gpL-like